MINYYEIRQFGKEEILYLYLDFNSEFSKSNIMNASNKLAHVVKKFIRDNKIAFAGTTVAIVLGGTILCNIVLNNNVENYENSDIKLEETINDTELSLNYEPIIEDIKQVKVIDYPKEVNDIVEDGTTISDNVVEDGTTISDNVVEDNETVVDNNIYVQIKRSNGSVVSLELEEYIIGVVAAEMPAAFHTEALKSQAIIARTYALKAIERNQILTDNETTQSYKDNSELERLWGGDYWIYYNKVKSAVLSTEGTYLSYNGKYIEAVYHSTSNGYTEDAVNVWGNYFPYLVSVESAYDSLNPSYEQSKTFNYYEISTKLSMEINVDTSFIILDRTSGDRVKSIQISDSIYSGIEIRKILGLRSADFDVLKTETGVTFITRGYGHGVGMSQYGANGMAKNGYNCYDILKHYYPGVSINYL